MATKVKPSRLQVSWTPQVWQVPVYVDEDTFSWWAWWGGGTWDVSWPASSTDWDVVLFDWVTGKLIKDSWVGLSSKLDAAALSNNAYWGGWNGDTTHTPTKDALYDKIHTMDVEIWNKAADTSVVKLTWNQTINWTKTFTTSPVVPSKTADATNTWTAIATEAQVYKKQDALTLPTTPTQGNLMVWWANNKAFVDGGPVPTNKAAASWWVEDSLVTTGDKYNWNNQVNNTAYGSSWDGDTTHAPSKDAVYDKIESLNTVIKSSSAPSTPTAWMVWYDTTNNVLKVYNGSAWKTMQELLVSGTNIKTINGNSILWSGNITVSSSTTTTCTLTSAWWSSNSQTVSVTGVTASNTVIVSPAPADIADYADCGVYCSAQASGTLTFGCDTEPSGDIVVNVLIMS